MRLSRDEMEEWRDDITEEVIRCPKTFMRVLDYLRFGAKNTRFAPELLRLMGIVSLNEKQHNRNLRHLRKATQILRLRGILIADVRSKKGGYFLATPDDVKEVERYCLTEEKLAKSMLVKVAAFRKRFEELCEISRQQVLPRNGEGPQRKLF